MTQPQPAISKRAAELIRDPERHTTKASAVDRDGNNVAGATDAAVAWSVYGAVNRVAVLEFNILPHVEAWRRTIFALREMGATHATPHDDALTMLREIP